MKRYKRLIPIRRKSSAGLPTCKFKGCSSTTFNQKRFCTEHVCETAYAKRLLQLMKDQKVELRALDKRKAMSKNSLLVKEALAVLWEEREISAPGLCRILGLTHPQARHLLKQVAKHGLATIHQNHRKKLCAKSTKPQEDGIG